MVQVLPWSSATLDQLIDDVERQENQEFERWIESNFSLCSALEQTAWKILSQSWTNNNQELADHYRRLFSLTSTMNHKLIASSISIDSKMALIFPMNIEIVQEIFSEILREKDEDHLIFSLATSNFCSLASFIHQNFQFNSLPLIRSLFERFIVDLFQSNDYKVFITKFQFEDAVVSEKQEFYLKVSTFFTALYQSSKPENSFYNLNETISWLFKDYSTIVSSYSGMVSPWNESTLGCLASLSFVVSTIIWSEPADEKNLQFFVVPNRTIFDFLDSMIKIIQYPPFHRMIENNKAGAELILVDSIFSILLHFTSNAENLNYFRSNKKLLDTLLIFDHIGNDRLTLITYRLQADILSENNIRKLNIIENMHEKCFLYLREALKNPMKMHNRIPLEELLKGLLKLSKNDVIKSQMAKSNQIPFLIELIPSYPIIYDIIWSLSFNKEIREELRKNEDFLKQLNQLERQNLNEQMQKVFFGLRWNLEVDQTEISLGENQRNRFDVMISYSHKNKEICEKIFNYLIMNGFRVWIDFNEMQGNIMEAMARGIEQSSTIILCISNDYQRSNYCRAEAQYAFKRRLKIIPILVEQSYKPDGWLDLLISGLLRFDFTRHPFPQAMQMLLNELKSSRSYLRLNSESMAVSNLSISTERSKEIRDWSSDEVQQWLSENHLNHMSSLLSDFDGSSLLHLGQLVQVNTAEENLSYFQEDSMRTTNSSISLIELARFQALVQRLVAEPTKAKKWNSNLCCLLM